MRNYATALKEWRPLADQGDAHTQFNLGLMYRKGQGVTQDDAGAVRWYRKAADQGAAAAQFARQGHLLGARVLVNSKEPPPAYFTA